MNDITTTSDTDTGSMSDDDVNTKRMFLKQAITVKYDDSVKSGIFIFINIDNCNYDMTEFCKMLSDRYKGSEYEVREMEGYYGECVRVSICCSNGYDTSSVLWGLSTYLGSLGFIPIADIQSMKMITFCKC